MACNSTPVGRSEFSPTELMYALYLSHPGLPTNMTDVYSMADNRQKFIEMSHRRRTTYRTKKDLSGDKCAGLSSDKEIFKDQANQESSDLCRHEDSGRLQPGEDVWFRVFPATKHGRRWKRGVILGIGKDIILAGGTRIGEQSDRGKTIIPSHH